ncbi:(R)-mandelonitrile lyase [Caulobacter hibisci]|uniref:Carboxymuconolactone decarboxylase family protein n=1 Tax=Caulobacter hibisci TaxID=2035993 RepID=A0ABS0T4E8_9CAUL|nr:carboxymuconolactone decarboxylase family protein [Caulobacter hibisci]MBI1686762.1 carboxymuconolactone decarboxylase family protein [Caulobacter hibisci]
MKPVVAAMAALTLATPVEAQDRKSVAPKAMQAVAPGLAGYTDEVLFGDVWVSPALSPCDRSLVTVSVLIATGKTAQLTGHLGRALDNGVTPVEIAGVVTHLAFYAGWPNAVSSLEVIEKVFTDRSVDMTALQAPVAASLPIPASDAARAQAVTAGIGPAAPKLAALTNDVLFADLWRRPDLAPRDRSLATIAALAANGDEAGLAFHVGLGLQNGLTRAEVGEALTHLAFYAGWPKATAAVAVADKAFKGLDAAQAASAAEGVRIVPPGSQPVQGPAATFTGAVTVTSPFKGSGDARLGGATVTFQPGARSNWHSHPLGQLLIVTAGEGLIQAQGEPVRRIKPGDVVWTPPRVKHWHGATPASAMTHVAVAEALDGASVSWLGPVTDAEYRTAPTER